MIAVEEELLPEIERVAAFSHPYERTPCQHTGAWGVDDLRVTGHRIADAQRDRRLGSRVIERGMVIDAVEDE